MPLFKGKNMEFKSTLTVSKIDTYNYCKKWFAEKYIKNAKIGRSKTLERGSEVHQYISDLLTGKDVTTTHLDEKSTNFLLEYIQKLKSDSKKIYSEAQFNLSKDMTRLIDYENESESFLRGIFDVVAEMKDGSIRLIDWKTGSSVPGDFQLQVYDWILRKVYPGKTIHKEYVMVDKSRVKEVEDANIEEELTRLRDEIYTRQEWFPEPGWYCKSICPLVEVKYTKMDANETESTIDEAEYYRLKKAKHKGIDREIVKYPDDCAKFHQSPAQIESIDVSVDELAKMCRM